LWPSGNSEARHFRKAAGGRLQPRAPESVVTAMGEHVRRLRLMPGSTSWPAALDRIEGPPDSLWVRGRLDVLAVTPRIAIVGTRAPTAYGRAQAERFARALAAAGVAVVSGLARGVDQAAHAAALEVGGATVAVLGSGVDRPWPACELGERIAIEGLLVSELAPEQGPRPHHFPLRNRLISGLGDGVLVVEAAQASGSLITARWAADQGRPVFALPGRVDHPMARGTHRLIREGAQLVESPEEILVELGLRPDAQREPPARAAPPEGPAARVLAALEGETLSAEELGERLGLSAAGILVEVVALELAGRVARVPGGLYRRL
jgi:DNA processing protein